MAEQGLDCLSVSELIKPAAKRPSDKEILRLGSLSLLTFFGDLKKVSGARCRTAQRHQEEFRGWKSARRSWQSLYLKYLRAPDRQPAYLGHLQAGCSETLINRAFQRCLPGNALSTRVSEHLPHRGNWKNAGAEAQAHPKKRWPEARVFRAFQRGRPEPHVNRASPVSMP